MREQIKGALDTAAEALERLRQDETALEAVARGAALLVQSFKKGGRAFSCGNGGSMCDAMHFAEELSGRFRLDRAPLPAVAISDPAHLTCVANDFGYDKVFSRYIEAHARKGDVLLAISTSGGSANVLNAVTVAKERGVGVIALTGKADARIGSLADVHIATLANTRYADRVQEMHIKVIHILIELCERQLFSMTYE